MYTINTERLIETFIDLRACCFVNEFEDTIPFVEGGTGH